jgi:hypothetical protein
MRILVQDSATKAFFDGGGWLTDAKRAKTFESVAQAEAVCREHGFLGALVVVKSKDAACDVSYPVGARDALVVSKPPTTRIKSLY